MKKIRQSGIIGQQGINLIEDKVLRMGSIWHPTSGMEAGIDGFIEFRDPTSGEMLSRRRDWWAGHSVASGDSSRG